jgi:uncharacterized protein (DUF362 family)
MQPYDRRSFLQWLAVQLAGLLGIALLAGCEDRLVDVPLAFPPTPQAEGETDAQRQAAPAEGTQLPPQQASPSSEVGQLAGDETAAPTIQSTQPTTPAPTNTPQPAQPTSVNTAPPKPTSAPPAVTHTNTAQPAPTGTPPAPTPTATPKPAGPPYLVVARGGSPRELTRSAISALGGIRRFVHSGDDVIIKPNMCVAYRSYEYAATTNPWVVGALVELAFEAGAGRVRVLDYPFGGTCEDAYVVSGIQEQVLSNGGEMEAISLFKFITTSIPQGVLLKTCEIYEDILNADVVINVPIAKHHSLAHLTLGMKNLMGTIKDRPPMHTSIGQRLADLASRIRPALTVVDAVRILVRNGPTGGSLSDVRKIDTLIATPDIVAADSYAATLFGLQPGDLSYVAAGTAMGLGRSDLENLCIEEINLG